MNRKRVCILSDLFNIQSWDLSCSCGHWIFTAFTHQVGHTASLFSLFVVALTDGCSSICSRCCHYTLTVHKSLSFHFVKKPQTASTFGLPTLNDLSHLAIKHNFIHFYLFRIGQLRGDYALITIMEANQFNLYKICMHIIKQKKIPSKSTCTFRMHEVTKNMSEMTERN